MMPVRRSTRRAQQRRVLIGLGLYGTGNTETKKR